MPMRSEGCGAKSVYISYQSPEALLLPKTNRAASLQILNFRNLLQNLQAIEKQVFFQNSRDPNASLSRRWATSVRWLECHTDPLFQHKVKRLLRYSIMFNHCRGQLHFTTLFASRIFNPTFTSHRSMNLHLKFVSTFTADEKTAKTTALIRISPVHTIASFCSVSAS